MIDTVIDQGLGLITLTDGDQGNLLNRDSLRALQDAVGQLVAEEDVRVILIRSRGSSFCLGMDLQFMQDVDKQGRTATETVAAYGDLLTTIFRAPKAVVALVEGAVKAGGMGLIAACDVVVAAESSDFELSEIFWGLLPANVLPFMLGLRIPLQKVRYLVLSGKRLSAREAQGLGLVDEVFPEAQLEKGIRELLRTLFRSEPQAVAETKRFSESLLGLPLEEGVEGARRCLLDLVARPHVTEGIAAFNEGAMPQWFQRFRPQQNVTGGAGDG